MFKLFLLLFFIISCDNRNTVNTDQLKPKDINIIDRDNIIEQLKNNKFDIVIIGGGATGAGAFLDAAARGLKVALLEQGDFSSETSSKSTKLIHGGVRYLENAVKKLDYKEYELVKDALNERKYFLKNASYLSSKLAIITPVYNWFDAAYYWIGLKAYDLLSKGSSLGKSEFLSYEQTVSLMPFINKNSLKGSIRYYDGQFNDSRMNIALVLTGMTYNGLALNYVSAIDLVKEKEKITSIKVKNNLTKEIFTIAAKVVINATGVFADTLRKLDGNSHPIIKASKGTHIVLPSSVISSTSGLIIPKTKDKRVIFLLPWENKTLVGTTDDESIIQTNPLSTDKEVEYLLMHINQVLNVNVEKKDILATYSGLRPLVNINKQLHTASLSRDHYIETTKSNLITIVGGKWTTYRKMSEEVIDEAIKIADFNNIKSPTKNLFLLGSHTDNPSLIKDLQKIENIDEDIAEHLSHTYGDRAYKIIELDNKSKNKRILPQYPFLESEIIYALRYEHATNAQDILARRLRLAFIDYKSALTALAKVNQLIAQEFMWNEEKSQNEFSKAQIYLQGFK